MGIEPTPSAWKAEVLPLNYTRASKQRLEEAGFEPAKAEPSDLQSDPFGRSGTPPRTKRHVKFRSKLKTHIIKTHKRKNSNIKF